MDMDQEYEKISIFFSSFLICLSRIAPNTLKGWIPVTKVIFGRIPIYLGGLALIQLITSGGKIL